MDKFTISGNETMLNKLQENGISLGMLMNAVRDSISIMNEQGEVVFWNTASEQLFGYTKEVAEGRNLLRLISPDEQTYTKYNRDLHLFLNVDKEKTAGNGNVIQMKAKHKDGGVIDIELSLSELRIESDRFVFGIIRDISENQIARRELENTRQEYLELAEKSPIGIVSCDHHGNVTYVNQMALNILGSPNVEETKKINLFTFPSLVKNGFSQKLEESIHNKKHIMYEINYVSKWGKKVWLRIHIKPHQYGDSVGAQIIIDDIDERKNFENELFIYSYTDALTGTYNRRYFIEKLEKELADTKEAEESFSLIMIDLDHFKKINDRFGHNIGDFVLKTISSEFVKNLRRNDVLARWGGEEFIVLLPKTSLDEAALMAEKLRQCLMKTDLPDVGKVSASFGVTGYLAEDNYESIIKRADNMLYTAKLSGRNCVKY